MSVLSSSGLLTGLSVGGVTLGEFEAPLAGKEVGPVSIGGCDSREVPVQAVYCLVFTTSHEDNNQ